MTSADIRHSSNKPGPLRAAGAGRALFLAGLTVLALTGCGGGSSSGTEAGALVLPSRIELTRVETAAAGTIAEVGTYAASGTDYANQEKESWVKDSEVMGMINGILGALSDSGYQHFVNAGPYQALVTPVDDSAAEGGSGTTEQLMDMVVEVTRASNTAPMIVKIWVMETEGPPEYHCLIRGHFVVSQGVSEEYPFGVMDAHFEGMPLDSNGVEIPGEPTFTLALSISAQEGQVSIQFYDAGDEEFEGQPYLWLCRANILASNDLSEGGVFISESKTRNGSTTESTSRFAFNQGYLKFQEHGQEALVQDKASQVRRVHDYRLFDATTGAALPLRSGFPVTLAGGQHGYVGYYGFWVPSGTTITHGMEVTRTSSGEPYELVRIDGRLSKHTRVESTLGALTGLEISVNASSGTDKIVVWNGNFFQHIATRSWSGEVTFLDPPVEHTFGDPQDGGWVEALRAWVRLGHLSPANSDPIQYHSDEQITPDVASDLTLYYWGFALDLPITQSVIDGAGAAEASYFANPMTKKTLFFGASSLLLTQNDANGLPLLLPSGLTLTETRYSNGYYLGPLTTLNTYEASNCWEIYEAETYYQWNTGPNEWNRFTGLKTLAGAPVIFDAPLRFRYTHSTANDLNGDATYDSKPFTLDYDGRHLHVPGRYDPETDCWEPMINLKDGTVLSGPAGDFVVKAVREEVRLGVVTNTTLLTELETTLPIDSTIPAASLVYDPDRTALVGARPAGVPLKVVKGDLVTATQ